ncbi:hypothetical protein [Desulfopila sp. IMCC35008]|uniref:hypothetical protein n=1 Tax=Desulfopila sp. IMCC35008 TaxID=2653858 RepID=UPI0013D2B2FE|nr:hypothetical protein [Desulfopila sp. IMCC35008]
MQESKVLLEKSVRAYQNMLEHVQNFKESVEKIALSTEEYERYNKKLIELQNQAEEIDKEFKAHFQNKTDTLIADTHLLQKKMEMMQEILEINNYLLPRLASLIDITKEEMVSLKKSVTQIGGYHSGTKPQSGRVIRNKG